MREMEAYDEVGVEALDDNTLGPNLFGEGVGECLQEGLRAGIRREHRGRDGTREGADVQDETTLPRGCQKTQVRT
jgi:hypothetical protein